MMAARNRPRAGVTKDDSADAHEERNMWNQIVADVKKLKQINAKAAEISTQIVELEAAMAKVDPETGKGRSRALSYSFYVARSRRSWINLAPGHPRTAATLRYRSHSRSSCHPDTTVLISFPFRNFNNSSFKETSQTKPLFFIPYYCNTETI